MARAHTRRHVVDIIILVLLLRHVHLHARAYQNLQEAEGSWDQVEGGD